MSELFKTAIVEKRNVLNELRSNNMTLQELRFFSIYLSKINPYDVSTRLVRFPLADFQRIMEFGKLNVRQLRASTDSLLTKLVHIPIENGGYRVFQLFKECCVSQDENGEWYVEIDAHDKALPLMFDFKNRYFKYELWNALRLKSPAQVRMYEILKQYEGKKKRELTVTELRELLGIGKNEYTGRTGWSDFKRRVLDSCQQALKETTDICYTYERGKVGAGGKWLSIIFHINKNTEYIDQLTLDEFIDMQPQAEIVTADSAVDSSEQLEGQLTIYDIPDEDAAEQLDENDEISYGSDLADLLGQVSCNDEFSIPQIQYIKDLVLDRFHHSTDSLMMCNYLTSMVHKMDLYKVAPSKRYNYLCKLLQNDIAENS